MEYISCWALYSLRLRYIEMHFTWIDTICYRFSSFSFACLYEDPFLDSDGNLYYLHKQNVITKRLRCSWCIYWCNHYEVSKEKVKNTSHKYLWYLRIIDFKLMSYKFVNCIRVRRISLHRRAIVKFELHVYSFLNFNRNWLCYIIWKSFTILMYNINYFRYLVGFDANFIFRPLWMLPEWISDRIIVKMLEK